MLIGYARVSTTEQSLALQQDALATAGCARTYTDVISGATETRDGLDAAFDYLRAGDVLVVWRLDRLGRSLRQLIDRVTTLDTRQVGFRSLTEAMDTTTCGGRLVFHMFGALAEFERGIGRERTKAGLAAARARGRVGGRPRQVTEEQAAEMRALLAAPNASVRAVCERFGRSRSTVYRLPVRPGADVGPGAAADAGSGRPRPGRVARAARSPPPVPMVVRPTASVPVTYA